MIRDFGFRELLVKSIRWADANDRTERMAQANVREVGSSYERTGGSPINPPVVRRSDRKLFSGHDRVAAAGLMKLERLVVHLMEGTDAEMFEVALIENAYRRHDDRDALKRQLVELRAASISKRPVTKLRGAPPARGRPPGNEAVAREEVAPALRTTPAALKQATYRDRRKARPAASGTEVVGQGAAGGERKPSDPTDTPTVTPAPIETFGLPVADELLELVAAVTARLRKADRLIQQAVGELTGLQEIPGYSGTKAQELRETVRRAGATLRAELPEGLCPWCKGQAAIECMSCFGQRFATAGQMRGVPEELLWRGDDAWVSVSGKFELLVDWRVKQSNASILPENRGKNGKRNGGVEHGR